MVNNWDDQLKAVSAGHAVIGCPAEAARFYPWPNLVYVPVRDAPPCRWVFAWRTVTNPLIRAFVDAIGTGVVQGDATRPVEEST